ncbi:rCG30328, partial [Rattus norvegicus]
MQLELWVPPCVLFGWWFSSWPALNFVLRSKMVVINNPDVMVCCCISCCEKKNRTDTRNKTSRIVNF